MQMHLTHINEPSNAILYYHITVSQSIFQVTIAKHARHSEMIIKFQLNLTTLERLLEQNIDGTINVYYMRKNFHSFRALIQSFFYSKHNGWIGLVSCDIIKIQKRRCIVVKFEQRTEVGCEPTSFTSGFASFEYHVLIIR